jgi:hypothetical protein
MRGRTRPVKQAACSPRVARARSLDTVRRAFRPSTPLLAVSHAVNPDALILVSDAEGVRTFPGEHIPSDGGSRWLFGSFGAALGALSLLLSACSWQEPEPLAFASLSVGAADLELHLRDDPYRSFAHLMPDGRNVFETLRWQIERLQRRRPVELAQWRPEDFVLELAHARTLERLHVYGGAAQAYRRVESAGDPELSPSSALAAAVMERFAAAQTHAASTSSPDEELADIERHIEDWSALAQSEPDAMESALASEEAESWEILRVLFFTQRRSRAEAIEACERLTQRHARSKLHPQHLMRLGDLHADAAHDAVSIARASRADIEDTEYTQHFEAALSAYEVAAESRNTVLRREAQSRLQALLSFHDGVRSGVH